MATFKRGQMVGVPCEIQPGAFPEENLITITTDAGVVSGFVNSTYIQKDAWNLWLCEGYCS
jgi:hypothetical protein